MLISMPSVHPSDLVVLESVESGHSSHSFNARVRELLTVDGLPMRMDSQAKYCALAMGRGHLYLRMPTRADYEEKIWVYYYFFSLSLSLSLSDVFMMFFFFQGSCPRNIVSRRSRREGYRFEREITQFWIGKDVGKELWDCGVWELGSSESY